MKIASCALLLGSLVLIGCARETTKGGPGARGTGTAAGTTVIVVPPKNGVAPANPVNPTPVNADENTFTLRVPSGATNITQGTNEEVDISINRGDAFKQAVKIGFKAPKGVKVAPAEATIEPGKNEVRVLIQVAADAQVGRHPIAVTGTPQTGKAVSVNMDIDVKAKD